MRSFAAFLIAIVAGATALGQDSRPAAGGQPEAQAGATEGAKDKAPEALKPAPAQGAEEASASQPAAKPAQASDAGQAPASQPSAPAQPVEEKDAKAPEPAQAAAAAAPAPQDGAKKDAASDVEEKLVENQTVLPADPEPALPHVCGRACWKWIDHQVKVIRKKVWVPEAQQLVPCDGVRVVRDCYGDAYEVAAPTYRLVTVAGHFESHEDYVLVAPGRWVAGCEK